MKRTRTKSGVYFIKNLVNGKVYTGSAANVVGRVRDHKRMLEKGKHPNIKLQNAWNKYGTDNFQSICIERVIDLESLVPREQYWIDYMDSYRNGYNMCPTAGSPMKGRRHSEKTKRKFKGRTSPMKGKHHTPEAKEKNRLTHLDKIVSPETKKKMSKAHSGENHHMYGKHWSDAGKKKQRDAHIGQVAWNKGIPCSPETKKKLSVLNLGENGPFYSKTHSPETKKKIGDIHRSKIVSLKTREKMSKAKKDCIPWNKGLKGVQIAWNKGKHFLKVIRKTPNKPPDKEETNNASGN